MNPTNGRVEIGRKLGFKCNQKDCNFVTVKVKHISQHVSSHINGKQYKCNLCDKTFSLANYLATHEFARHNIKNKPIMRCPEPNCQYSTFLNQNMKQHSVKHKNEKHLKCGENGCDKSFKTWMGLNVHRKNFHSTTRRHVCSYAGCGQRFDTIDQFRKHIGIHTKPFVCDYDNCSFSTEKKVYLYYHKKNIHLKRFTEKKTFKCDVCPKTYERRDSLQKHKKIKHTKGLI